MPAHPSPLLPLPPDGRLQYLLFQTLIDAQPLPPRILLFLPWLMLIIDLSHVDVGAYATLISCPPTPLRAPVQALIDGPESGVQRQALNFKNISLTDLKVDLTYGARSGRVGKAFIAGDIANKWAATAWAKKRAMRVKRASLSDFDRFVVKVNKQKVSGEGQ